jgi:hypothetical protein
MISSQGRFCSPGDLMGVKGAVDGCSVTGSEFLPTDYIFSLGHVDE